MKNSVWKRVPHILAGAVGWWAVTAWAQPEPARLAAEVDPEATRLTLWQLILAGGWTMVPLALCSVAVVALVIRNFLLLKPSKLLRPDLLHQLQESLAARDVDAVTNLCRAAPCLLTLVLRSGLSRASRESLDLESVEEAARQAARAQMTRYSKSINYLSNIGVVSPMLGLLGTVSGMIKAFQNISVGGMGRPELLAGNIGEALVTTATGLIIAIPAMLFHFYFRNSFAETVARLSHYISGLLNALRTGEVGELDPDLEMPLAAPPSPTEG
jgi:biopolymer transport protein ExbB